LAALKGAPRNTPAAIVDKLNKEINAGLVDPKIKARLAEMGGTVLAGSPADFGRAGRTTHFVDSTGALVDFYVSKRITHICGVSVGTQ